jgi:conjugative relaxase-like TrwC/TraI family protein
VLSVAKLSPGQEAYYERSVADGIDDYYAGRGESPGVWTGAGAGELELEGVVGEGELGKLISGRHPHSSGVIRSHAPKKQITLERIDPATGERYVEAKTLAPLAGYDLVFSPPKSVSLLHALGNEQIRQAVDQAHLTAWQAALAYLEREACVTRRGKNGRLREHGTGFVAAAYRHRTSRAQDPHLHTHVIVANMTKSSSDGEWRALDGEPLLKHYRLAAGYLYQAQLRHELTHSLGLEWQEPREGMAEVAGVPDEALAAFSQRRAQVLDYLERQGSSGFYAAKVAALATRERKEPIDLPRLHQEWQARAAEHGLGRRELKRLLDRTIERDLDERDVAEIATRLLGPEGLTEKQSTFTGAEAVMAWAQAHTAGAAAGQVLALVERFLQDDQIAPIAPAVSGRPASFSTAELLRHERVALELAEHGRNADAPSVSPATIARVVREHVGTLGREQAAMVCAVASSRERVVCVVGHAGAGKTSALAALADAYQRDGNVTLGAAPSGIAAANLATATGISTGTLHRLLAETRHRDGLPPRCLLVVDEAAMADTGALTRLLFQLERTDGKAVLVGDPAQLSAVGPGGLFAALAERQGAIELHDNHRQQNEPERNALALLRDGRSRDYLTHAAERGRVTVAASRVEAKARLLADWWRAASTDLAGSVMIAYRRADVAELNAAARTLLDREQRLGRERLQLADGTELAIGDRVLCTRNNSRLHVANGDRGTITSIDHRSRAIVVEFDDQRRLELPRTYLVAGHVTHAYALTGHKTQGLSVERAFVLADAHGHLKEWGYVALSRAREQTHLYTVANEPDPDRSPHRPEPASPLDRLAEALTRPAAESLALDATARHHNPHSPHRPAVEHTRRLGEHVRALEQERTQTARELHEATRQLAGMGALRRARHGRALRDQVNEREADLVQLDHELKRLNQELRQALQHALESARTRSKLERSLSRDRTLERDLRPEPSLDRGIEI